LAKRGEKYKCAECGLMTEVEATCCCEAVELLCGKANMKPGKAAAKVKPKAKKRLNP